jgi:hypothetical protein
MKILIIISLCLLVVGCGEGNYNRGYVISKSAVESETPEAEE